MPKDKKAAPKKKPTKKPDLPIEEYKRTWPQEKNYKFVKRFNDPRFGEVSVVKNPTTNHVLMVKEKMVTSKMAATNDITELKSRMALNHPNLLKMVNYTTAIKKELCSTNYLSRAYYEFPRTDMHKEQLDRKKALTEFNDRELTHMTYQSLNGLNHLHSKGLAHGDLRPRLVGLDKTINGYSLLDRFADPTPIERCQTNNMVNNKDLYMGPQLYHKLKGKKKGGVFNKQKNDVYALGMTVLNTGTMDSVKDCYLPDGRINQKRLDEHLEEFDKQHKHQNPVLSHAVRRMLEEDEEKRPSVNQMMMELPSYDDFKRAEANNMPFDGDGRFNTMAPVQVETYDPPLEPATEQVYHQPTEPVYHQPAEPVYHQPEEIPLETMPVHTDDYQQNVVVNNAPPMEFNQPTYQVNNAPPVQFNQPTYQVNNAPPMEQNQTSHVVYAPQEDNQFQGDNKYIVNNQAPQQVYVQNQQPTNYYVNQDKYNPTYSNQNVSYNQTPLNQTNYTSTIDESNPNIRYMRSYQDNSQSNYTPSQQYINTPSQQNVTYVQNQPPVYTQTTYDQQPTQSQTRVIRYSNNSQNRVVQNQPPVYTQTTYEQPQQVETQQEPTRVIRYSNNSQNRVVQDQAPVYTQTTQEQQTPVYTQTYQQQAPVYTQSTYQQQPTQTYTQTYEQQAPVYTQTTYDQQPTQTYTQSYEQQAPVYTQTTYQQQPQTYTQTTYDQQPTQSQTRVIRYSNNSQSRVVRLSNNSQNRVVHAEPQTYTQETYNQPVTTIRDSQNVVTRVVRRSYRKEDIQDGTRVIRVSQNSSQGRVYRKSGNGGHVVEQRKSITFHNTDKFGQSNTNIVSHTEAPVEVRRGSQQPPQQDGQIVKKKYVMQEDGTIVEVNVTH